MDNKTKVRIKEPHDRLDDQQTFNRNIVKRIQELEDKRQSKLDDQLDIQLMKQKEFNANVVKRLEELEDYTKTYSEKHQTNQNYSFERRIKKLEDYRVKTYLKLERIDDILVVHKNQTDNQRKNFCALRRVLDDKVMDLLEKGEHGKQE